MSNRRTMVYMFALFHILEYLMTSKHLHIRWEKVQFISNFYPHAGKKLKIWSSLPCWWNFFPPAEIKQPFLCQKMVVNGWIAACSMLCWKKWMQPHYQVSIGASFLYCLVTLLGPLFSIVSSLLYSFLSHCAVFSFGFWGILGVFSCLLKWLLFIPMIIIATYIELQQSEKDMCATWGEGNSDKRPSEPDELE